MKFAWTSFLLVLSLASVMDACTPCNEYRLTFTRHDQTTDYAIKENSIVYDLSAVTVCFFVRDTDDKKPDYPGYPINAVYSYAVQGKLQTLEIFTYPSLYAHVGGKERSVDAGIDHGIWNHICFTWSNTNGDYKFYKDAEIVGSGTGLYRGGVIKAGGTTVIGQDQDSIVGGGFDPIQAFVGDLSEVNVWGVVLSESDILAQFNTCHISQGSVNWWSQFKDGVHGEVKESGVLVVEP